MGDRFVRNGEQPKQPQLFNRMIHSTNREPLPGYHTDFLNRAAIVLAHGWLAAWAHEHSRGDSPYEDQVAAAVHTLLWEPLKSGVVTLERHVIVPSSDEDTSHYEVDAVIDCPETGARLGVEVAAWRYHANTAERWDDDVRRARQLRRQGLQLECYTTLEIRERGVWAVAADIMDLLRSAQGFGPLELPEEVIAAARLAGSGHAGAECVPVPATKSASSLVLPEEWSAVRDEIRALPSTWCLYDPAKVDIRQRYPRAYESWEETEIQWLRDAQADGLPRAMMTEIFARQPTAIDRRLRELGLGPAQREPATAEQLN